MADLRPLFDWTGEAAELTLWVPPPAALDCAARAPRSAIPPSFEQEQHLLAFRDCERRGEEMARLLIVVWEERGRCDVRAMNHVVNAHLRRHDTYQSRFDEQDGVIVRHTLSDMPAELVHPVVLGKVDEAQWRGVVAATPSPLAWDCFRFGVLQRKGSFTVFASIDHLHADSTLVAFLMEEIRGSYWALVDGERPEQRVAAGSYLDYCSAQRRRASALTLGDADVDAWVQFLERNGGRMPAFKLPLGISEDRCLTEHVHVGIIDDETTVAFEASCHAAGTRAIGGVLAVAAMAERSLTGTDRYSVITPTTTRKTPEAFRTVGWCMGVIPIDFRSEEIGFPQLAAVAQRVFDERARLAGIPIERVLELAASKPSIRPVATGGIMLSYMDVNLPPLSAHIAQEWQACDGRVYINQGMAAQVALWIFRTRRGLSLTAAYPATPEARASVQCYVDALRAAFIDAAGGRRAR